MPTFDVVSEIDMQELRNAVDQASREITTRFDFKDTNTSIELGTDAITLASITEDRLAATRQLLEEKMVKRKVSLKVLDYGIARVELEGREAQTRKPVLIRSDDFATAALAA